jgi:hypothetical protein
MPVLPNPKHERAAQNFAKGNMLIIDAYTDAGFERSTSAATQFFKKPHIAARIAEIRAVLAKVVQNKLEKEIQTSHGVALRLGITKEKIISALWYNANRCLRGQPVLDPATGEQIPGRFTGQPDARGANQALKLLGLECHGMFIEKLEIGGPGDFSRLSDDEFEVKFREEALAVGLPEDAVAGLLTYEPSDESNK